MAAPARPAANGFVARARNVYRPVGFAKGYNFVLWFLFAGAMIGFCLARLMYLDYDGVYCSPHGQGISRAAPGECCTYGRQRYLVVGIKLHLYTILPAAFLACFQFVPVIRHKAILLHRSNGYLILLLVLVGTTGALMIARHSFGGGIKIQAVVGLLAIMFLGSLALALYNIKMLQIEQHRAWMLRAWFYAAAIITCRIIMIIASVITSAPAAGPYYVAKPCEELATLFNDSAAFVARYPPCTSPGAWAAVRADLNSSADTAMASLNMTFGMAVWLALAIHAIGVEVYLHLTPVEAERLRNMSYQRQLEAGFKHPGSSGLTADRIGDAAPWAPERGRSGATQFRGSSPCVSGGSSDSV